MPLPKLLQGKSWARKYPASYTAEERRLFRDYSRLAEQTYPRLFGPQANGSAAERPTIDPPVGRDHVRGLPDHRGDLCTAGMEYVRIEANGRVERCGDGPPLGNLLKGGVRFATGPEPCDRRHCFYVCARYTERAAEMTVRQRPASDGVVARLRQMVERLGTGA
jgi:hypothetical protein